MVIITSEAIDPTKVYRWISAENAGSLVFHFATVKPLAGSTGGTINYIDYATDGDAEAELQSIAEELSARFAL